MNTNTMDNLIEVEHHEMDAEQINHHLAAARSCGQLEEAIKHIRVRLGLRKLPSSDEQHLFLPLSATMREVFEKGAKLLGEPLLPPHQPLDWLFHQNTKTHDWGEPLQDFEVPLWFTLAQNNSRHFGIQYRLVVSLNGKWGIAPSAHATPRELLVAFGYNPAEVTLYAEDADTPLPVDQPLRLRRGLKFEAQADGKYGDAVKTGIPRGFQSIEDDVNELARAGLTARLFHENGQRYVEVRGIELPSPPWSTPTANILITIPATYPTGPLDAFYLETAIQHQSGAIPRQQQTALLDGRGWALISWHYTRSWNPRHDDLASHLAHCRGFLLQRGVVQ